VAEYSEPILCKSAHRIKQEIKQEKEESNRIIEFDAGRDEDDSDYDDVEEQERILNTQY
jgi:hypothetical protein